MNKTKLEVNMNAGKTNHYLLAYSEKPEKSVSPLEWASMFTIAVAFAGLAAMYI